MAVFTRRDSAWFWLYLEPLALGERGLKERTQIRADAKGQQLKDNRALAEAQYHKRMAERVRGTIREERPSITFEAFVAWFKVHRLPHRKGRVRDEEIIDRLVLVFGGYPIAAITPKLVHEKWITPRRTTPTTIAKGHRTAARVIQASDSTINREVDTLKCVLSAGAPEYYERSPLYGMKRLKTITPKRRLLEPDEERRLLLVMTPADRALFLIGLDGLVRFSDILDLKWSDYHDNRFWVADPKAGGGFAVPASARVRKALKAMPRTSAEYIFAHRRHAETEHDRRSAFRNALRRYCERARPKVPYGRAIGGITFHWATRRTGATRMLTRGVDPGTVQKVGRWKTAGLVLDIYHELLDDKARDAVEVVGKRARPFPRHSRKRT